MEKREEWALAARHGLYLSLATIAASIIGILFPDSAAVASIVVLVKYAVIVYLVYLFMKRFSDLNPSVTYGQSFRYGFKFCLLSAIVCTFWVAVVYIFLKPELIDTTLDTMMATLEASNISVGLDYDDLKAIIPSAIIFSQALNCVIWGLILPSIIANWTKKETTLFE